jgi:spore germination protein GerM
VLVDETPDALLRALLAGPNAAESGQQYRTALPDTLQLLSATRKGALLVVDVTPEIQQLSGDALVLAVAQIVYTGTALSGVTAVRLLVNGAEQQWPAGNGEVQSDALTVYDFPGLVQSAQPAYPAIPSPSQA